MNRIGRIGFGVVVAVCLMWTMPQARAQALKQIPADAAVVFRINNVQVLSDKVASLSKKLGVADFAPQLADPLAVARGQLSLGDGFNAKGEVLVAMYEPGEDEFEPRVVIVLPVTDYKAFLGNMANANMGEQISSFTSPDGFTTLFAVNREAYAVISPTRQMLEKPAAGIEIQGAARNQFDTSDIAVYANAKMLAARVLPRFKEARDMIVQQAEAELGRQAKLNPVFLPVIKAALNQCLNVAEGTLNEIQGAAMGIRLSDDGMTSTILAEFNPGTYAANMIRQIKTTNGPIMAGLPDRKFFVYGGMVQDPAAATKVMDDFLGPISKELAATGADGKLFRDLIEAARSQSAATESAAFGYGGTVAPGQGMFQVVGVMKGDAQKIVESQRTTNQATQELMKLLLAGAPEELQQMQPVMTGKPGAKTVEGVAFDEMSIGFKVDRKTPEGMQIAQMMDMMYGGTSINTYAGAADARTFVMAMGGGDELLSAVVRSAKQSLTALDDAAHVKAVASQLPANRAGVLYVSIDNIVNSVMAMMAQQGMPFQFKLPPDLPPMGFSLSTEGSAIRIDAHVPAELVRNIITTVNQVRAMMMGGPPPGAL